MLVGPLIPSVSVSERCCEPLQFCPGGFQLNGVYGQEQVWEQLEVGILIVLTSGLELLLQLVLYDVELVE